MADRVVFGRGVRQVAAIEPGALVRDHHVQAPVVGPQADVHGFVGVAMVAPFDRVAAEFEDRLPQPPEFFGHPGHRADAVDDPLRCPLERFHAAVHVQMDIDTEVALDAFAEDRFDPVDPAVLGFPVGPADDAVGQQAEVDVAPLGGLKPAGVCPHQDRQGRSGGIPAQVPEPELHDVHLTVGAVEHENLPGGRIVHPVRTQEVDRFVGIDLAAGSGAQGRLEPLGDRPFLADPAPARHGSGSRSARLAHDASVDIRHERHDSIR